MSVDPRVHVTLEHLRSLQGAARGLNFLPRQPARSVLNGRHASRLRGRGLNFEEMRNYLPGDDIRSIDWKATARTGDAHVRVFTEERDRPALLVVDQRMSMFFGSRHNMKSTTAAEAAALAAFRILAVGDRVGGIAFDDERQLEVKPQRSAGAVFRFLEQVVELNEGLHPDRRFEAKQGWLNDVLGRVSRIARHDHLVLVFSDFDGIDDTTRRRLAGLANHNDVILLVVHDPTARTLDSRERLVLGDADRQAEFDFGTERLRESMTAWSAARLDRIFAWQNEINLSVLPLTAGEETLPQLRQLMGADTPRRRVR